MKQIEDFTFTFFFNWVVVNIVATDIFISNKINFHVCTAELICFSLHNLENTNLSSVRSPTSWQHLPQHYRLIPSSPTLLLRTIGEASACCRGRRYGGRIILMVSTCIVNIISLVLGSALEHLPGKYGLGTFISDSRSKLALPSPPLLCSLGTRPASPACDH